MCLEVVSSGTGVDDVNGIADDDAFEVIAPASSSNTAVPFACRNGDPMDASFNASSICCSCAW